MFYGCPKFVNEQHSVYIIRGYVVFASPVPGYYVQTWWHHPQNRKYITYRSDRATAMDNMHKIWWSCHMWILSKCGKDWAFNSGYMLADRKTNRHAHTHTHREREKETCMVTILRCLPGVRNSEEQLRRNYKLICRSWVEWMERRVDNKIRQSGGSQKCR